MEEEAPKSKKRVNFKDKKVIGVIGLVIALIILAVGAYVVFGNSSESSEDMDDSMSVSGLPELSPEDIGMEVTVRDDNKALMFELTKADDIESVEYTIEYEREEDGRIIQEGFLGMMNIGTDGITKTDEWPLGTCSSGTCRYHDVVSDVTINLKVSKTDGKDYKVTKVVKLDS